MRRENSQDKSSKSERKMRKRTKEKNDVIDLESIRIENWNASFSSFSSAKQKGVHSCSTYSILFFVVFFSLFRFFIEPSKNTLKIDVIMWYACRRVHATLKTGQIACNV